MLAVDRREWEARSLCRAGGERLEDLSREDARRYYTKALELRPDCVPAYLGDFVPAGVESWAPDG